MTARLKIVVVVVVLVVVVVVVVVVVGGIAQARDPKVTLARVPSEALRAHWNRSA